VCAFGPSLSFSFLPFLAGEKKPVSQGYGRTGITTATLC